MYRSIFAKLFLIVIANGIAVNVAIFVGLRRAGGPPPEGRRLMGEALDQHFVSMATAIGVPPNPQIARDLARDKKIEIRVEGPGGVFATREDLPVVDFDEARREMRPRPMRLGGIHAFRPVRLGQTTFTFYGPPIARFGPDPFDVALILLIVTAMMSGAYFALRAMLRPLRDLTTGVEFVGKGDFGHRVPVRNSDELGRLAGAFNGMLGRIQQMVAAKEHLLVDVSHELQSPLARMKMAIELLRDEDKKRHLARDVSEMEKMVVEILESARLSSTRGAISPQNTELVALMRDHLEPYREQTSRIVFATSASEIHAEVDARRVVTVLRNLVDNALKYSDPNSEKVEVKLVDLPEFAMLVVRDYGIGIPEEEIPLLFEPFYRVDKSRSKKTGGYGLGLSLCQKIVAAHGGKIEVVSGRNCRGTTVTVMWPKTYVEHRSAS